MSGGAYNLNSVSVAGPVQVPSLPPDLQKLYPGGLYTGGNVVLRSVSPADGPKVPIETILGSEGGDKHQWGLFALTPAGGGVFVDANKPAVHAGAGRGRAGGGGVHRAGAMVP